MKKSLLILVFLLSCLAQQAKAQMPVYVVSNGNDSGPGSLRQAIIDRNNNVSGWTATIEFRTTYIQLSTPLPALRSAYLTFGSTVSYLTIFSTGSARDSDGIFDLDANGYHHIRTAISNSSASIAYQNFLPKAFVVTNTQPSGAGSLVDMVYAAGLRTVSTPNSIVFNIPGQAPHVISVPETVKLTSSIVLDGSTQPANGYTGSSPKIELDGSSMTSRGIGLFCSGAYTIEVYGLYLHGFKYAIFASKNLTIGSPGKGNVIAGNDIAIGNVQGDFAAEHERASNYADNILIQNNIIGLSPDESISMPNKYAIRILGTDLKILNNTLSGNSLTAISSAVYMSQNDGSRNVIIKGNKIGVSSDGTKAYPNKDGIVLRNSSDITIGGVGAERNIISNHTGSAISLTGSAWIRSSITNNYIGTDITGTKNFGNGTGILINSDSIRAMIGGNSLSEGNLIAYNKIGLWAIKGTLIRNNSIFRNEISIRSSALAKPTITLRSTSMISGTAIPHALVQLFEDDGYNQSAQGKTFIGETTVDGSGNWSYSGTIPNPCQITAITLQPQYYRSSDFSLVRSPKLLPDSLKLCNGLSHVLEVQEGFTTYLWEDGSTNRIRTITQPGQYTIEVDNGCKYFDTIIVKVVECRKLKGIVYLDKNLSYSYDSNDELLSNIIIEATTFSGVSYYTTSESDGVYSFELPDGEYTIKSSVNPNNVLVPATHQYVVTIGNISLLPSYNFGVFFPQKDILIKMSTPAAIRSINPFSTVVTISNNGTENAQGRAVVSKDPFMNYVESSVPLASIANDNELVFDVGELLPNQSVTFTITWSMDLIPFILGKTIYFSAFAMHNGDELPDNNYTLNSFVNGYPYDPNHKYVSLQYNPNTQNVKDSKRLQYHIDFQNTGTAEAFNIIIKDTLSFNLDPSTFKAGLASHPYTWGIDSTGIITFTFANIHLPDSSVSQEGSKGFVTFTIDHKPLPPGSSFYNRVGIIFDLNEPIITNKAYYSLPLEDQTISINEIDELRYGTPYVLLDASASSGLPLSYAYEGPIRMSGDTLFLEGVGATTVEAFQEGNETVSPAYPKYIQFNIKKGLQTIAFDPIADKVITAVPFQLSATGGASLQDIVFTVISGPATVNGNTVNLTGSGEVVIAANQAGNDLYEVASEEIRSFQVSTVTTAIPSWNDIGIEMGPNPFSLFIDLQSARGEMKGEYTITNLNGQTVDKGELTGTFQRIQLDHLAKGIYFFKLNDKDQRVYLQKILKQ